MADREVVQMVSGTSISLKYAHIERERRFLFQGSIPSFSHVRSLQIRDCYLLGTTLRLRRVDEQGLPAIFKLGQKVRVDGDQPSTNAHTSMYISKEEFELLSELPCNKLEKLRRIEKIGDFNLSIDVFGAQLIGLVLAEIDLGVSGTLPDVFPLDLANEVTNDERFTGGALAKMTANELNSILNPE